MKKPSADERADASRLVTVAGHIAYTGEPPCPGRAGWRGRQPRLLMSFELNTKPKASKQTLSQSRFLYFALIEAEFNKPALEPLFVSTLLIDSKPNSMDKFS